MMDPLRAHLKELHPGVRLPRANKDLVAVHSRYHHRYASAQNHYHEGGMGRSAADRPEGWRTGGQVIMRPAPKGVR